MLIRTAELLADGWTKRGIRAAVDAGSLTRLREGAFAPAGTDADCVDAGRSMGRLTGVSELRRLGVFVLATDRIHIHVAHWASRVPAPARTHRIHRRRLLRTPHPGSLVVEPIDAAFDAVLSQAPRAAIASLDSALHLGALHPDDLDELFAALPRRFHRLRRLIDGRAESGPETLLRLILRALGCSFDCQVVIDGVGRVDFLVEGWLIVECDSEAHHSGWAAQRADRRRDREAAARGYATLRVIAEDIFWHPEEVRAALLGLVRSRPSRIHGRTAGSGRGGHR